MSGRGSSSRTARRSSLSGTDLSAPPRVPDRAGGSLRLRGRAAACGVRAARRRRRHVAGRRRLARYPRRPAPARGAGVRLEPCPTERRVIAQEERLRGLVDVGILLTSELSLESVLDKLLEAAIRLTDARYAALGVVDRSGQGLERFVHRGIDEARRGRSATCRLAGASSAPSSRTRSHFVFTTYPRIRARSASRRGIPR